MPQSNPFQVILLLDSVRSAHNVGAIWRTAEAVGVQKLLLCGLTPCPNHDNDNRLPHVASKADAAIAKTALGAELKVPFEYYAEAMEAVTIYKKRGYHLAALEQAQGSTPLFDWQPQFPLLLSVGHETAGTSSELLKLADEVVEIPMIGTKESLNVSVAAGVALYWALHSSENSNC